MSVTGSCVFADVYSTSDLIDLNISMYAEHKG